VIVYLMENRQERKISSAVMMAWKDLKYKLHFGVSDISISDTGRWRCQGPSRQESRSGEMRNAEICWFDSISEFQIPGFWIPGGGDVKDPHDRSPEVEKCETRKYFGPTPFRSFRYRDFRYYELEMSRTLTKGVPKKKNAKH
jgi:hypothetical protein